VTGSRPAGYGASRHRAPQWVPTWYDHFHLVPAMDEHHLSDPERTVAALAEAVRRQ
jgi:hypothetical protein